MGCGTLSGWGVGLEVSDAAGAGAFQARNLR